MRKQLRMPSLFVGLFLTVLLFYALFQGNYEFVGYAVVVGLLYYGLVILDRRYSFPLYSIWLFIIWIVLHMLGGLVKIGSVRLYDLLLIPFYYGGGELVVLKYDQLIHFYCYFAISILLYYILKAHLKKNQHRAIIVFAILSALGIGLLNEVIEFGMVLFADAASAVGGYYNNALDLVFNLLGAVTGVSFVRWFDS